MDDDRASRAGEYKLSGAITRGVCSLTVHVAEPSRDIDWPAHRALRATLDTGAVGSAVSQAKASELSLPQVDSVVVDVAHSPQGPQRRPVVLASLLLRVDDGRWLRCTQRLVVTDASHDFLFGMDLIKPGELWVSMSDMGHPHWTLVYPTPATDAGVDTWHTPEHAQRMVDEAIRRCDLNRPAD